MPSELTGWTWPVLSEQVPRSRSIASIMLSHLIPAEKPRSVGVSQGNGVSHPLLPPAGVGHSCVSVETLEPALASTALTTWVPRAAPGIPAGVLPSVCLG